MKRNIFVLMYFLVFFLICCSNENTTKKNAKLNEVDSTVLTVDSPTYNKIDDSTLIGLLSNLKKIEQEINSNKKRIILYLSDKGNESFNIRKSNVDVLRKLNLSHLNSYIQMQENSLFFWKNSNDIVFCIKKDKKTLHTIVFSKSEKIENKLSNTIMYEKYISSNWLYRIVALLPQENTG